MSVAVMSSSVGSDQALPDKKSELGCAAAEALGGQICTAASLSAQSECQLLELIGEFDAGNAVRWWTGVTSLAHWLSWACSMSPDTAREHVRVARALRQMPTVTAAFREGRLSYSKVREISRVVDLVDDAELCELALTATAAQLARMISSYRTAAGTRITQERLRGLSWTERQSGIVDIRVRLPKEEAAVILAALNAAKDQYGTPPSALVDSAATSTAAAGTGTDALSTVVAEVDTDAEANSAADSQATSQADTTPAYGLADAMLDVARLYLSTAPEDRSGEDRSLVVVHVNAELLGELGEQIREPQAPAPTVVPDADVPAGTSRSPETGGPPTDDGSPDPEPAESMTGKTELPQPAHLPDAGVPAGTPHNTAPICHIDGVGGIEPDTARKLSCDADLLGAVVDASGEVLALGRTRRLVTRAQRRALMIRDHGICQFTGCHQTRHLQAHHIIHWCDGGPTDLINLILLCQRHHTVVHEGGMIIQRSSNPAPSARRWEFLMPEGSPHREWYTADGLLNFLARHTDKAQAEQQRNQRTSMIDNVVSFRHPHARRIQPGWRGERFDLHECVQALFRMHPKSGSEPTPDDGQPTEARAA